MSRWHNIAHEAGFRVPDRVLPTGFYVSAGQSRRLDPLERTRWRRQRSRILCHGTVLESKVHNSGLRVRSFFLRIPARRLRVQPVRPLAVSRHASPQAAAFDLREQQALGSDVILGAKAGVAHSDLSVLPVET